MRRWPKEKRGGRYQVYVTGKDAEATNSDVELVFTRAGLEFSAYYDTMVGLPGGKLTWDEIDSIRSELQKVRQ